MVPSINADGRAHNKRGNTTGQDLNRDHALIEQNETKGFASDAPRLHARRRARQPRGRQRGPADPRRAPPQRLRAALRREQADGQRVDVRRRRPVGLVDGPVQHRRRQPRGHPAQHRRAQERRQHARRGARRGRRDAARPRATANNPPANRLRKVYAHLWENWETLRYFNAPHDPDPGVRSPRRSRSRPADTDGADRAARRLPVAARSRASARRRTTSPTSTRRWRAASSTRRRAATSSPQAEYTAPAERARPATSARSRSAWRSTASRSSRAAAACSCRCGSRCAA